MSSSTVARPGVRRVAIGRSRGEPLARPAAGVTDLRIPAPATLGLPPLHATSLLPREKMTKVLMQTTDEIFTWPRIFRARVPLRGGDHGDTRNVSNTVASRSFEREQTKKKEEPSTSSRSRN